MSDRATIRAEVLAELPVISSGEDGQNTVITPDNPNYLPIIDAIAETRFRTRSEEAGQELEQQLRAEYLAIMRECRDNTATAARVRRGLYLVMRLAARTYYTVNE